MSASQPFPALFVSLKLNSLRYSKIALESRQGLKAMKIQISTKLDGLFTPVRAMKRLSRLETNCALRHLQKHPRRETPDTCPDRLQNNLRELK